MGYHYLVLANNDDDSADSWALATGEKLSKMGMQLRLECGPVRVYASEETPMTPLPGGGVSIGHLFTRHGEPVGNDAQLRDLPLGVAMRKHILHHYWGEYLLILPSSDGEQSLRVMRDPSGGVACVYGTQGGTFFLTSDISIANSLGLCSRLVDWNFIAYFLMYPNHKTHRTALRGIHELLPGFSLLLREGKSTTDLEWSPWFFVADRDRFRDGDEAARTVRKVVDSSVLAWAGIDDSILLELSGGLDSSVVAACLRTAQARVVCCTMATAVPGADERKYASIVADNFGFPLRCEKLTFDSARIDFTPPSYSVVPCMTALQYATNSMMETIGDASGVESYFSGGGGDTVFCYLSSAAPAADAVRKLGLTKGVEVARDLAELHHCTFWKAARLTLIKLLKAPKASYRADRSFLNPGNAASTPDVHPWTVAPIGALHGDLERITSLAGTQMFRDGLPRGAQRWLRMPLLSQPVMEACLSVPSWMWVTGGLNRAVARAAFSGLLPQQILDRRSKGTFVSYSGAVLRRNRSHARDFLLSGRLREYDLLDIASLEAALDERSRSQEDSLQRILDLCMVENWVRHQS